MHAVVFMLFIIIVIKKMNNKSLTRAESELMNNLLNKKHLEIYYALRSKGNVHS